MSTENDNSDEVVEPIEEAPAPPRRARSRLPGPGIGEAFLWIIGFMGVQAGFGYVMQMVVGILTGGDPAVLANRLGPNGSLALTLSPMVCSALVVIPAAIWRLRPEATRKLNLGFPSITQLIILLGTTVSLSFFGSHLQALVQSHLLEFIDEHLPELRKELERLDVRMLLMELQSATLPVLLIFLAVVPAVGEEFLFRGLIGRGIVARWGIGAGVIITSLLFAGVHLYPPQVIGLIPLAVFLHISYLATRSFWAPMLVHFVNNALAALALKLGPPIDDPLAVVPMTTIDWILMILSGLFGALGAIAIWSVRTEYVSKDGDITAPSYPTVERPPAHLGLKRSAPMNISLIVAFTALLFAGLYIFWKEVRPEPVVEPARTEMLN